MSVLASELPVFTGTDLVLSNLAVETVDGPVSPRLSVESGDVPVSPRLSVESGDVSVAPDISIALVAGPVIARSQVSSPKVMVEVVEASVSPDASSVDAVAQPVIIHSQTSTPKTVAEMDESVSPRLSAETVIGPVSPDASSVNAVAEPVIIHSQASTPKPSVEVVDASVSPTASSVNAVAEPVITQSAEKEKLKQGAMDAIESMTRLDMSDLNEPVSSKGTTQLAGIFENQELPLDLGQGHRLLGFTVRGNLTIDGTPGWVKGEAVFEGNPDAKFELTYNPNTKECIVDKIYRGKLPTWIQYGDNKNWLHKDKGIPTAKVIQGLLAAKMGITQGGVETMKYSCLCGQSFVDVIHGTVVQEKSIPEAWAASQTSECASGLAQLLGYRGVALSSIESVPKNGRTYLGHLVDTTGWSEAEKTHFANQKKLNDIKTQTGLDLLEADEECPEMYNYIIPGSTDLTYKVI